MARTPGILNPLMMTAKEMKAELKKQGLARGWTPLDPEDGTLAQGEHFLDSYLAVDGDKPLPDE